MTPPLERLRDRLAGEKRASGEAALQAAPATQPAPAARGRGGGRRRRKTFILGLGCQKGGTSWVNRYLTASPEYAKGFAKEYHVWDSIDLDPERWERTLGRAAAEIENARRGEEFNPNPLQWAAMCGGKDGYYDYFAGLLERKPRFRATGDLTPAYNMLSAERVAGIRDAFARRRVRTVGIFLMRDPVERVWSAARMLDDKHPALYDVPPEEIVARHYADPFYSDRSRYDHTLEVVDEVFAPNERFIGFYEDMFTEESVRELCQVIGITFMPPDFDTRHNASPKRASLPDDLVRTVAEHHRGVYEAVAARFPEKDLKQLWPSSRFVL